MFFLNCFSSFLLCLIYSTLMSFVRLPSPSLPNPLSIVPCLWLQVLQLRQSETLQERWSGVQGGGAGEGLCHVYCSHPASKRRKVLPVQVLGQWFLSTGWGSLFKCGNVPCKLGHLAPLHSMSDFSFICCHYECHKHG